MKRVLIDYEWDLFRLALLEDGEPVEFYVEQKQSIVGNIYIGRVLQVVPNLQAAFVDIGTGKNGYYYYGKARAASDETKERKPKVGEQLLVQVEKDPIGEKGAVLTQNISFAGKFLVLLPEEAGEIGISRKIKEETERQRIRAILEKLLPENCGVIVRTNGAGRTEQEFEKELRILLQKWTSIQNAEYRMAPALLWQENEPALKAVKDFYGADVDSFVVNDHATYQRLQETGDFDGEGQPFLQWYEDGTPLFSAYYVESKLEKALSQKVWLKNGGFLVIEETEACVVIDVNSAKTAGKGDLEKNIWKTNLEAAKEVAKQMRLRNLSGIIIIDFIDMVSKEYRQKLQKALEEEVAKDRIKTVVVGMTELGLMQVTRKKTKPSLQKQVTTKCRSCEGSGAVFSLDWTVAKMRRETKQCFATTTFRKISVSGDIRLLQVYAGKEQEFLATMKQYDQAEIVLCPKENTTFGWYHIEKIENHTTIVHNETM